MKAFSAFTAGILDTVQDLKFVPKAQRKVLLVSSEQRFQVAAEMLVRRKCVAVGSLQGLWSLRDKERVRGYRLCLFRSCHSEDRGSTFLRNVGTGLYTVHGVGTLKTISCTSL